MQRYFAKEKGNNNFILEDSDYYHIKTVMRMCDNTLVEVVYDNKLYICCLGNVKENPKVIIKEEVKISEDNMPNVTLIIPLLKEQKMDLILQKATELGVYKIIPVELERSIIKVKDEKQDKKLTRWYRICKEASEQSKRVDIPVIENIMTIDDLKNLDGLNLICSTLEKSKNIKNMMKKNTECGKINVVIGPEGGLSESEENKLIGYGFKPVTLGNRIMRVETVPIYILSIINYEFME